MQCYGSVKELIKDKVIAHSTVQMCMVDRQEDTMAWVLNMMNQQMRLLYFLMLMMLLMLMIIIMMMIIMMIMR